MSLPTKADAFSEGVLMFYMVSTVIATLIGIVFYFLRIENIGLVHSILLCNLVFGIGFFGLFNFVGHSLLSERVARGIGWASNGFQKELGFVSLGIGICGILCYWFRDGLWLGTIIVTSAFLLGAAALHVVEIVRKKNFNRGNTWIIIPDLLIPSVLIVLYVLAR
jgi:hypothetical protein